MIAFFSKAREIAHAAVAVVGSLAGAQWLVIGVLHYAGVTIGSMELSGALGKAGIAAALASKLIDSLNDAIRAHGGHIVGALVDLFNQWTASQQPPAQPAQPAAPAAPPPPAAPAPALAPA